MKEQARKYLQLGWSVIPLRPGTKIASVAWNDFRTRTLTEEELERLPEDANLGLACGALSNILVVDIDLYKGKAGIDGIDSPLKAVTPRGGLHMYFRYTPGTQNTANAELGVDIRSEGGYVVLPPSVVSLDGTDGKKHVGQYMWVTEPTESLLEALPEAPKALLDAVYAQKTVQTSSNYSGALDLGDFAGLSEGGRNNGISRASLSALNKLGNPELALSVVKTINSTFNPPLPEQELLGTFESAVRKWQQSPPVSQGNHASVTQKEAIELPDAPVPTQTFEDIEGAIKLLAEGKKKGIPTGFPQLDAIMGGFIPGQSYLLFADTNVGKSMFAVNMLVSMAERGVKVLYFDLENDMSMTMERIMMVANRGDVTLTDYKSRMTETPVDVGYLRKIFNPVFALKDFFFTWDLIKLTDRFGEITWPGVEKCIQEGIAQGVQVVIIDHLHYFSPSETDHAVLGEIARQVNNMAATENIAILLVAHTKKGLVEVDKKSKDQNIKANRPTIDHISGSAMIAKHFKNIIGLQRNYMAPDRFEKEQTKVYVDKTKYGPSSSFELSYNEMTLMFVPERSSAYMTAVKTTAMDEMLDKMPQATLIAENDDDEVAVTVSPAVMPLKSNPVSVFKPPIEKVEDGDLEDIPF